MTLLRTSSGRGARRSANPAKGFLRTRRAKPRVVPRPQSWMDAAWYDSRNDLRNRFEALRSGEYSVKRVLNENWMTPTAWYALKNELRDRFQKHFLQELN
jgi:hypothetical protein